MVSQVGENTGEKVPLDNAARAFLALKSGNDKVSLWLKLIFRRNQ